MSSSDESETFPFTFTVPAPRILSHSSNDSIPNHRQTQEDNEATPQACHSSNAGSEVFRFKPTGAPEPEPSHRNARGTARGGEYPSQGTRAVRPRIGGETAPGAINAAVTLPPRSKELAALNLDVLEHIVSFLPGTALAALMATCRQFLEVATPWLCRRTKEPLINNSQLFSFYCFVRAQWRAPRAHLIRELHFCVYMDEDEIAQPDDARKYLDDKQVHLQDVMLHILQLCQNLRRLRIDYGSGDIHPGRFSRTIAAMSALEELDFVLPIFSGYHMNEEHWCNITKPRLRKLVLNTSRPFLMDDRKFAVHGSDVLENLRTVSDSLVDLRLPDIHGWTAIPGLVFPCVQRLAIGLAVPTQKSFPTDLKYTFPNLRHLTVGDHLPLVSCGDWKGREEIERMRAESERLWTPGDWPSLTSLICDHSCGPYVLAVPIHIPYFSTLLGRYESDGDMARRIQTVVTDIDPVCMELRIQPSSLSFGHDFLHPYDPGEIPTEFLTLHPRRATPSLRRCIITVEPIIDGNHKSRAWHEKLYRRMFDALASSLTGVSITHLLIRHRIARMQVQSRTGLTEYQVWLSTILTNAHEMAALLAPSSRTLRWVGIHVEHQGLRSWEITSSSPDDSAHMPTLEEVDEDQGWSTLASEQMFDFMQLTRPHNDFAAVY